MSPQGVNRKRPAPGTSPVVHPQLGQLPNYPPSSGSPLSNEQFLQWGQNPPSSAVAVPSFPSLNSYNTSAGQAAPTQDIASAPTASNQIARRQPANQLVNRNRTYEQPSASFPDQDAGSGESGGWSESLEELYQRANAAKREAQAKRKQIPPFVQKLSSFLDESKNTDLIRWSDDGNSFIVLDEDEFAKTLIPELFKHNNYASFVRQLNMYGFHKKVGLSDNSMRASERKNKSPSEYANPYFKKGHPELLWLIQKPKNAAGQGSKTGKGYVRVKTEEAENENEEYDEENMGPSRDDSARNRQLSLIAQQPLPKDQFANVYRELQAIRQQQQVISNTISKLRREHEQLYAQAANFQEQHNRHENSINAILTFLATVYNRSLQGQEGQNLANSFAGAISQDQGNVVDMDDFSLGALGGMNSPGGPRSMKKQPLLLKAPPTSDRHGGRATTLSPAASGYERPQSRTHVRQGSAQSGQVEEVFDTSPRAKDSPASQSQQYPQRDIMSVIQNTNARNGIPTTYSDFPNVLSSLETSGGNVPLTANQRADMLRLMANETSTADPGGSISQNNALVTPIPPPMPHNYSNRLANTRSEIDNLMKMQAEQDRSVQNLTNLLQPLSPNGTIPGIGADGSIPPPPLELDQIFNNDYFTDFADYDQHNKGNLDFSDPTASGQAPAPVEPPAPIGTDDPIIKQDGNDLFDFDHLAGDNELFGTSQSNPGFYAGFENNFGAANTSNPNQGNQNLSGPGRVVETLTDSESTSPSNTIDDPSQYTGLLDTGYDSQGGKRNGSGVAKRRKKA
ncbi:hypothetical protein BJX64DRAFT_209630 [Aspergillus heterothallicus]